MKTRIVILLVVAALFVGFGIAMLILMSGRVAGGWIARGSGMMGDRCPICGGPWQNPIGWNGQIPDTLPKPKRQEWYKNLQEVLALERLSKEQYTADEEKYKTGMPYMMIIPQEDNHIYWIGRLFEAYGLKSDGKVPPVRESESVNQAYEIGRDLEAELIPRYVWLIQNAEDNTAKQALDTILIQTRMHYTMFTHALGMPGMGMRY